MKTYGIIGHSIKPVRATNDYSAAVAFARRIARAEYGERGHILSVVYSTDVSAPTRGEYAYIVELGKATRRVRASDRQVTLTAPPIRFYIFISESGV